MLKALYTLCAGLILFNLSGQVSKKSLTPLKTTATAEIDGFLTDSIWSMVESGGDFVMLSPGNGSPIPEEFDTRFKVFYTDEAMYIGIEMKDPHPDSILTQVAVRDDYNQNNDWVVFGINPFNDGQNDFNFFITAAGLQADSRTTANGDDFSLNSVWKSAVQITDEGWTVELEIPYIALRFPNELSKDWGFNIIRSIRRNRTEYSWNFIDRGSGYSFEYQAGLLKNISGINPPVRFSLMPYASAYADNFAGETNYDFNAGMDLKYGVNESFTLDATLIPDFGQVAFDQQILNLSPFENRFQENRQFFVEGTDLFSLGDLFYSRRIGGAPRNITNQNLNSNDSITVRTEFTRLLNASKISGRTAGNLGIGFLNAVTDNNYSTIIENGEERQELLEPLTNYNILVLDQRINRASSVSFINTNVLRNGGFADANVAGLLASIYDLSGQYRVDAELKRSDKYGGGQNESGYAAKVRFGDVDGHWRWATMQDIITDQYDPNDLGFLPRNNLVRNYSEVEYLTFEPSGPFNRMSFTLFSVYSELYEKSPLKDNRFEEFYLGFNSFFLLRDFTGTGVRLRWRPNGGYDYFEPRMAGRYFTKPDNWAVIYFLSTDYRKPLALDLDFNYDYSPQWDRDHFTLNLEPRIRLGDHFFMIPQVTWDYFYRDYGFAGFPTETTNGPNGELITRTLRDRAVFGERNVFNLTALIDARYAFNPLSSLGIRLRQFWSRVNYLNYFDLEVDGGMMAFNAPDAANYNANIDPVDFNLFFNTLNLDLRYSWWFAPASEMVILYRVALSNAGKEIEVRYLQNIDQALGAPIQNNISIRISYFLDYHQTKSRYLKR